MVVDYLTSLRKRAEDFLRSHFGNMIFETTAREYIITVPAIVATAIAAATVAAVMVAGHLIWWRTDYLARIYLRSRS